MKSHYLKEAGVAALLLSVQPALAATFIWNPQTTDTGSISDFDTATQSFAAVSASTLTFSGDGYYHSHGGGTQAFEGFTIRAMIDGLSTTIYSSPITSFTSLSSLGTINFAGGNVTSITLSSKSFVSNAFHDFAGGDDSFTLAGSVSGSVPEPSTWAMMLLGFGAIGLGMRRKQRQTVNYSFA